MVHKIASLILVLFLVSCNNSGLTSSIHEPAYMPEEITTIPGDDISDNPVAESTDPESSVSATPITSAPPTIKQESPKPVTPQRPKPSVSGTVRINPVASGSAQVRPPQPKIIPVVTPRLNPRIPFPKSSASMSKIIQNAYLVMNSKKDVAWVKTACNRYLSLVLARSGYSRDGFLANDFDIYAKKNLKQARDILFKGETNLGSELARLKQHIWSYPERTPFILQWTRPTGRHGHVAILERIGDRLFIFQASLGAYEPRMNEIKVNTLLNSRSSRHLNVYSEL